MEDAGCRFGHCGSNPAGEPALANPYMPDALNPTSADLTLRALATVLPGIAATASARDADGCFPAAEIAALAAAGALRAPLPRGFGGLGWGSEPHGAGPLALALRRIGRASLPLGRLFEGHVNALRLVMRHGSPAARAETAAAAQDGLLFAVWNTPDPAGPPLRLEASGLLRGAKVLCSGAGDVARAIVTAETAPGQPASMVLVPLGPGDRHRADLAGWTPLGMRASATGRMDFDGIVLEPDALLGAPGAYSAEPDLSAGAWRFCAVQLGGAEALAGALRAQLRARGRGDDPHQAARLGQAALALETGRLWVTAAAVRAEAGAADAVPYVYLARHAIERMALTLIEVAQRSAGLAGLLRPDPIERIGRDLATYLRQPAPDRALALAAAHVLGATAEPGELWGEAATSE